MNNIFKELKGIGLSDFSDVTLYEHKKPVMVNNVVYEKSQKTEKDFIYDKKFECPVCNCNFTSKVMKSKCAKLVGRDFDYKPNYEEIEAIKYNVVMCPRCGYSNLINNFTNISPKQKEMFKEKMNTAIYYPFKNEICTQEEAIIKFKMALLTNVYIKSNYSTKAFICLQLSWLYRSFANMTNNQENKAYFLKSEKDFYKKAFEGYVYALQLERPPLSVWDENKFYYIFACLAYRNGYSLIALRFISNVVLQKSSSKELKDRARTLRDTIKAEMEENV